MASNYESYLIVLDSIKTKTMNLSELLETLVNCSFACIKSDFSKLKIPIQSNSFNVDQAKLKIRQYILHNKTDYTIPVEYKNSGEILYLFQTKSKNSILDACIRDSAYNYLATYPEDLLLSLALLKDDNIAFKHQIVDVNTAINKFNNRCMIIDDVGLGKTVTALLWLYELVIRMNGCLSALILVPANLKSQWFEAIRDFFGDKIPIKNKTADDYKNNDILLLSVDQAKMGDISKILLQREWDCLILDESHEIRNMNSKRFKFVYSLNAAYKLFLTATPVHNTAYDLYSQSLPILPGLLGNPKQFSEDYLVQNKYVRTSVVLRKALEKLMIRTRRDDIPFNFARHNYFTEIINEWTKQEYALYDDLLKLLVGVFKKQLPKAVVLKQQFIERTLDDFVLKSMLLLCEMASHPDTALKTISKTLKPAIEKYAEATNDYEFVDKLDSFINKYNGYHYNLAKVNCLIRILKSTFNTSSRHVIVFVNYIKTSEAIEKVIKTSFNNTIDTYKYIGKFSAQAKTMNIDAFVHSEKAILLSTDAGGQGLNLNVADVVINYDYPWNPMKVEQRIGRIDRLNTKYENIYIYNLITKGTIEQYIYQTLIEKITIVKDVIGDIMSPIEIEEEWERKFLISIGHIILLSEDGSDLKMKFEKMDKKSLAIAAAQTQYSTQILERYKNGLD